MARFKSILVFHFGALGDFITSWPALGMLRLACTTKRLGLFGNPSWARLILAPECIRDRESGRFAPLFLSKPHSATDAFLKNYDLAVIFSQNPRSELEQHLNTVMPQECWRIPTRPELGRPQNSSIFQIKALKEKGLATKALAPPCCLPQNLPQPRPVVAPGSGGRKKRLSCGEVLKTVLELEKTWPECLILLGPAEDPAYVAEIRLALAQTKARIKQNPTLPALAGYLYRACFYLGADSGVSHLAGALGAPSAVVFKASDPQVWTPQGPLVRALTYREFNQLLNTNELACFARTFSGQKEAGLSGQEPK